MKLIFEDHATQTLRWPSFGRCILAHYDDDSVVVYQAYNPSIGNQAALSNRFGDKFSFDRMSWIKPNFLWMMYRSGWGTRPNQTVVLAVHLKLEFFEKVLRSAIHSSFDESIYANHAQWKKQLAQSEVRLQWDPDHGPSGAKLERRAIQLGLRGKVLRSYATEAVTRIDDVSELVREGRSALEQNRPLMIPEERVFTPSAPSVRTHLGL